MRKIFISGGAQMPYRFPMIPSSAVMLIFFAFLGVSPAVSSPTSPTTATACNCTELYREYTRAPTDDVRALFQAAADGDEVRFTELISRVPDIALYAVNGKPLLDVLLSPAAKLFHPNEHWYDWWDLPKARTQEIVAMHAAMLPAKTRMLALALQHGVSVRDTTYQARRLPLHAAIVWGSPEMVGLLLSHGADVNQAGASGQAALEVALDPEFSRQGNFWPTFVTPENRSVMIGMLLKAGAQRPFTELDTGRLEKKRIEADYRLWPAVAAMTRGEEVMQQLLVLGTRPATEEGSDSALVKAARTGNLGGVRWLKQNMPRMINISRRIAGGWKNEPYDLWSGAASWALYPYTRFGAPGASRDEILSQLITQDTPWLQTNELSSRKWDSFGNGDPSPPQAGQTLLHHLVHTGAEEWVTRAVRMGAPVDGAPDNSRTPLVQAVQDGNIAMVRRLLHLGANPLGSELEKSPLFEIVKPLWRPHVPTEEEAERQDEIRQSMLELMLAALTPEQKALLAEPASSPLSAVLDGPREPQGGLVRVLLAAGLPLPPVNGNSIVAIMRSEDPNLVQVLLDHGLRVHEVEGTYRPVLVEALGQNDLILRLLEAGANPNLPDQRGMSAVAWAVLRGDVAALDLLLAKGGRLESAVQGKPLDALHELAFASRSDAMLARLGLQEADLAPLCFADKWDLIAIALDSTDSYWGKLLQRGFGKASGPGCSKQPSSERLIDALLSEPEGYEAGWSGERLTKRLAALAKVARPTPQAGQALMASAFAAGRQDVVSALKGIGVAVPVTTRQKAATATLTAAEWAAMRKLAGNYYLRGVTEVGSQLRLNADASFSFMLAYGALDQAASGQWRLQGGEVQFQSPDSAESPDWQPYQRGKTSSVDSTVLASQLRVQVRYRKRPIDGVTVTGFGCQAPQRAGGKTSSGVWQGQISGRLCQIVLRHPSIQRGRAYVYEVPPSERTADVRDFVFEAEPGKQDTTQPFNVRMQYVNGALVWLNKGRHWEYFKE
ncbi:ankyrin repeat domain-containing protein [Vogesella facilis]|uniref:Ankyrin repeat domain-containing protein n=1 Tax=Vogesella facilis TaxID=1655232 RepID=A0ABV7RAI4_9NEIS